MIIGNRHVGNTVSELYLVAKNALGVANVCVCHRDISLDICVGEGRGN
jgi:hypothetical protein